MTDVTRILSRYVCESRFDAMPSSVRHEGVRAFVNWMGCAAGGAREKVVESALSVLVEFNGKPEATIIGRPLKMDALNATFVNALSSGALAFNDTHYETVAHPTSSVAAALLAVAERQPVSGREFVHALILGDEVQCRIAKILCCPPAECQVGLSSAGLVGGIGAAVAVAKIFDLDETGVAAAIGLAANQAAGLREAHGTMGSQFTTGQAGRSGLFAALLAQRGFTCTDTMIEGVKGFAVSYSQNPNLEAALEGLGRDYEMSALAYKPYPSGFVVHPVIDACLDLAREHSLDASAIDRIELDVNPLAVALCNRPNPENANKAIVSIQHWAAAALLYRVAGIAQIAEGVVADPEVSSLRRKIILNSDPAVEREAARVRVTLRGGARLQAQVTHCRGSVGRPMTDEELSEKARGQLEIVFDAAAAEQILEQCWRIEAMAAVADLCPQLATAG